MQKRKLLFSFIAILIYSPAFNQDSATNKQSSNSVFFQDLIQKFLIPILVATVTYILFRRFDEWKRRREQSKLGVAIIDTLIEEIQTGADIMSRAVKSDSTSSQLLPKKSWNGMTTISDDILLRIIEVSKNVTGDSFHPYEIRTHCKNYFDHMTLTWENVISDNYTGNFKARINNLIHNKKFLEAANGVLKMLKQTRKLLLANSIRWFPK